MKMRYLLNKEIYSTYAYLTLRWLSQKKLRLSMLFIATALNAMLLPFAFVLAYFFASNDNGYLISFTVLEFKVHHLLDKWSALVLLLLFSGAVITSMLITSKILFTECLNWQDTLMKSTIKGIKTGTLQYDKSIETSKLTRVFVYYIRSALIVERLISVGLYHLIIILVCFVSLSFIAFYISVFILGVLVLFFPFVTFVYNRISFARADNQKNNDSSAEQLKMHMDRKKLDEESLSSLNFRSLFKTRTDQLYLINVLKSLVYVFGLIMFLPVAMNIKTTDGSEGLPEFIIITLIFLMIRSLLSFLSLLARVSRNYEAAFSLSKLLSKGSLVNMK